MEPELSKNKAHQATLLSARLFRNGTNQAVRLPRELEFDAEEVYLRPVENGILLTPKPRSWTEYFKKAHTLSDDFPDTIDNPPLDECESL